MTSRRYTLWRRAVQVLAFVFFVYGGWAFARWMGGAAAPAAGVDFVAERAPVVDTYPPSAVCRFTAYGQAIKGCIVELLSRTLTEATPFARILPYLAAFIVLSFLLGRWWCGWVCPLGTTGDLLDAMRARLGRAYWDISPRLRAGARITNYSLLGVTLAASYVFRPARFTTPGECRVYLPFCKVCPARVTCPIAAAAAPSWWGGFATGLETFFTVGMWVVLAFFVFSFLAMRRLWCHFCPIGLCTSWFNRGGGMTLEKECRRCNRCGACADACPMGLTHMRDEKRATDISSPECILCMRCVETCPREDCLRVRLFGLTLFRSRLPIRRPLAPKEEPKP